MNAERENSVRVTAAMLAQLHPTPTTLDEVVTVLRRMAGVSERVSSLMAQGNDPTRQVTAAAMMANEVTLLALALNIENAIAAEVEQMATEATELDTRFPRTGADGDNLYGRKGPRP